MNPTDPELRYNIIWKEINIQIVQKPMLAFNIESLSEDILDLRRRPMT